jgi:hypothetical protein
MQGMIVGSDPVKVFLKAAKLYNKLPVGGML